MKPIIILMLFLLSNQILAQSEESGILKTVNDFLDGGTNGNVSQFQGAFVADAVQRSIGRNGNVIGMTVESLASKLKPGQTMDRQTRIVSWSYAGISAIATTETIYPTSKIVDYLNLLKIGDDWKIVTRVYSRIESDESITNSAGTSSTAVSKPVSTPAPKKKKPEVVIDDGW
ncbi:nuclear transport factor 2 family protein [Jiulongibacter sediminis]|jgi:hypothetical protein|uniref:nuclear transport factor 2 family protein n=1 Tax=Jiulongibacter sediminis TaxID=1605367 RepID=UPI0026F071B2|nr:nuclear transport factor 2 family protein [Jiulongibacter sediminis]